MSPALLLRVLLWKAAATLAGVLAATATHHSTLAMALAALTLADGLLVLLLAMAGVAGGAPRTPPTATLVQEQGLRLVDGPHVLRLPEVNP